MMRDDGDLRNMIRRLAAMSSHDRTYVVNLLSQSEAGLLEPHLKRIGVRSMSPALHALVKDCDGDGLPTQLTPRSAAALRAAAASNPPAVSEEGSRIRSVRGPWRDRLGAWLDRG